MEPHDRCHWDEWLNKALQQYGEANPRPGIENRVLANSGEDAHGDRDDFWFRGIQVVDGRATPRTEVKVPPLAVIGDPNELARLA